MFLEKIKKNNDGQCRCVCSAVDVFEAEKNVVLKIDMPGVDRKTLSVDLQGDQLTISGYRPKEALDGKYAPLYEERVSGIRYYRAFQVSAEIDREKISANYKNGILEVILAKSQTAQPKKIEIRND